MPLTINGVRNQIFPAPVSVINGAKLARINGISENPSREWLRTWNGHRFAPPETGSVLYLPGYPGFGSTIFDFSMIPEDSAINTNEVLDDSETDIDCDADATTAIPVGTEIRIDSEWMKVTATGITLTVIRGFNASTPASHVTNSDIWKMRAANNGTISGATWARLPSGLWYPDFDATDDVITIAAAASINNMAAMSWSAWIKPDTVGEAGYGRIFDKATADTTFGGEFGVGTNNILFMTWKYATTNILRFSANDSITMGVWQRVTFTWDGSAIATNIKFYVNDVETSYGTTTNGVGARADDSTSTMKIGNDSTGAKTFDGGIALPLVRNSVIVPSRYKLERSLFGV